MVKSEIISKLSKKIHPKLKNQIQKQFQILFNTIIEGINEEKLNFVNLEDFHQKIKGRINARNPKSGKLSNK